MKIHVESLQGDAVSGGNEDLGERLSFKVKSGRWDLISGEEKKLDAGRGMLVKISCLQ